MEKVQLRVEGMSCNHCVRSIEGALGKLAGISKVSVSLKGKIVDVEFDPAKTNVNQMKEVIENQGYEVK